MLSGRTLKIDEQRILTNFSALSIGNQLNGKAILPFDDYIFLDFSAFLRYCVLPKGGMGMENIISELYYGNIRPVEQMGKLPPEVKAILKRLHESEDKLEESLNEQAKALLHAIQDDRLEATCIIQEKRFCEAFTLGARLMAEMLMGSLPIS